MTDIVDRARQAHKEWRDTDRVYMAPFAAALIPELVAEIERLRPELNRAHAVISDLHDRRRHLEAESAWFRAEFPDHGYPGGDS